MNTLIVTPDLVGPVRNGGIGTFAYHWACLLKERRENVSILFTGPVQIPKSDWQELYDSRSIPVLCVHEPEHPVISHGNWWFVRRSRLVAERIPADTDVVYFQDWQANGFIPVRQARYRSQRRPVSVTVLHSSEAWIREGMREYAPDLLEGLSRDFAERYVAEHSDFVVSPSRHMLDWVRENGWKLPGAERIRCLGYPYLPPLVRTADSVGTAAGFRRIVFFGRLEKRKGLDVLIDAIQGLAREAPGSLQRLGEVVLLGKSSATSAAMIRRLKRVVPAQIAVRIHGDADTFAAQEYLTKHAADTLAVLPSAVDNYPFGLIETSLIPGLNLICSNSGGTPEILGDGLARYCFDPTARCLAEKLKECLAAGPRPAVELPRYDYRSHNDQWLAFHREVGQQAAAPVTVSATTPSVPRVDVCVAHHNQGQYLAQALAALERQTVRNFGVCVVDDSSTEPQSLAEFARLKKQYAVRGWQFLANEQNLGASRARNAAAAACHAPYITFVDADNVPMPNMLEEFLRCITASGDDCLTCYFRAFRGEQMPYVAAADATVAAAAIRQTVPTSFEYLPLGASLELSLFENFLGDTNFIIRREVFEKLQGFPEGRVAGQHVGSEDYELLVRLVLAGYRLDVIPEFLFYYRYREDGFSRVTNQYLNTRRVLLVYRQALQQAGLEHLVPAVYGLYKQRDLRHVFINHLRAAGRHPLKAATVLARKLYHELKRQ